MNKNLFWALWAALVTFVVCSPYGLRYAVSGALWEMEDYPGRSPRWARWAEWCDAQWPWAEPVPQRVNRRIQREWFRSRA